MRLACQLFGYPFTRRNGQAVFMPCRFKKIPRHLGRAPGRARREERQGRSLAKIEQRADARFPEEIDQRIEVVSQYGDAFRFVVKSNSFDEGRSESRNEFAGMLDVVLRRRRAFGQIRQVVPSSLKLDKSRTVSLAACRFPALLSRLGNNIQRGEQRREKWL